MAVKLASPLSIEESTPRITFANAQEKTSFQDVLTLEEAADFLRISVPSLLKLAKTREIPARRIGTRIIFGKEALLHWVNSGT